MDGTDIRIAPTRLPLEAGTRGHARPGYWSRHGHSIRSIVAEVFGIDDARIEWPEGLDGFARYDIDVHTPEHVDPDDVHRLVRDGIRRHFQLAIEPETRVVDVYVLTAPDGPAPNRRSLGDEGGGQLFATFGAIGLSTPDLPAEVRDFLQRMAEHDQAGVSGPPDVPAEVKEFFHRRFSRGAAGIPSTFSGTTDISHLCRLLGSLLGRPVVDETGLTGSYEIEVREPSETTLEGFLRALRDQAGLVATPERREVSMLVVRPVP
jgi:Protein of unknown function (DUF3738)